MNTISIICILGPNPYLIFTNRVDIRNVDLDNTEFNAVIAGLKNAIALDFHYRKGLVFWSDVTLDTIKRVALNGSAAKDIITRGLENPGMIAIIFFKPSLLNDGVFVILEGMAWISRYDCHDFFYLISF